MSVFSLTILGTSSAIPSPKRNLAAHVLNVDGQFFLIDCGEGTQIQFQKYGIIQARINHIFISHLHGDHYFGLFGLLSSLLLLGRTEDLHIYGPPELEQVLYFNIDFLKEKRGFAIQFHATNDKQSELIFENNKVTVHTIPLKHRIETTGFLFTEKPRKLNIDKDAIANYQLSIAEINRAKLGQDIVREDGVLLPNKELTLPPFKTRQYAYCSDTQYLEKNIPLLTGVDLLYHEATYADDKLKQCKTTGHSTARQAAKIARMANVGQLVIGHFSQRYKKTDQHKKEATEEFENTIIAEDGMTIAIPPKREL